MRECNLKPANFNQNLQLHHIPADPEIYSAKKQLLHHLNLSEKIRQLHERADAENGKNRKDSERQSAYSSLMRSKTRFFSRYFCTSRSFHSPEELVNVPSLSVKRTIGETTVIKSKNSTSLLEIILPPFSLLFPPPQSRALGVPSSARNYSHRQPRSQNQPLCGRDPPENRFSKPPSPPPASLPPPDKTLIFLASIISPLLSSWAGIGSGPRRNADFGS